MTFQSGPAAAHVSEILPFDTIFWVFLIASILGVIIEGLFCKVFDGHWETHVLTVWGWFNFLYGGGAVLFFVCAAKLDGKALPVKVLIMTVAATVLELFAGLFLKKALGMRAWDYSDQFLNYDGLICPLFSLGWAAMAFLVCKFGDNVNAAISSFTNITLHKMSVVMLALLIADFIIALICIWRWSRRHYGYEAINRAEAFIDRKFPDEWMSKRFIEWKFLR